MNVVIKNSVNVNNKSIIVKPIDFEAICALEDLGFDIANVRKKLFGSYRCVLAYNADISLEEASKEIENHIKNGGKLNDLYPFVEAILNSDFFKSMLANSENKE